MLQQNLGIIADIQGDIISAFGYYNAALTTLDLKRDCGTVSKILSNLGYLYAKQGRDDDARISFDRALCLARESEEMMVEGIVEENRAELELNAGDIDNAYPSIERALSIADRRDDTLRFAAALKLSAIHQRLTGDLSGAIATLQHALALAAPSEDALLSAELLFLFGCFTWELGDDRMGRLSVTNSLEAFRRIHAHQWVTRAESRLSRGASGRYC
jgi:tetratricopeptide (TPR) repeat protein